MSGNKPCQHCRLQTLYPDHHAADAFDRLAYPAIRTL